MPEPIPSDSLVRLEEQARRAAGVPARIVGARVELLPVTLHEAARAQAVRALLGPDAARVVVSLAAFDRIDAPDPSACTIRAGGSACVGEVDNYLRGWALTLGALTPRARSLTVRDWLTGPHAGLRPVPGNRLESAALSISVALEGGGIFQSHPSPRSAMGPILDGLFLGAGSQAGLLVEARLRALPRAEMQETVHASVERPEDVVALRRTALQKDIPLVEVQVGRKARGFAVDLAIASPIFRARRDRAALEALVAGKGEIKAVRRVYERELPFEGELGWERLAFALALHGPMGLFRLARESVVVVAAAPVKGARPLDAEAAPLPDVFRTALGARGAAPGEKERA